MSQLVGVAHGLLEPTQASSPRQSKLKTFHKCFSFPPIQFKLAIRVFDPLLAVADQNS